NVLPDVVEHGAGVVGRPGFRPMGEPVAGEVQWIGQLTRSDGLERTVRVKDGQLEVYDWGADRWTVAITREDLEAAGVQLATSGRVRAVNFADRLVLTDGVHKPFAWDGGDHGGLELLTNAPVIFGGFTIYYARLFAIKAAERSTIVWCEPGQPNVGWESEGYNNSWTLRQTDQAPLYALCGTNTALYYLRARSAGAILGAVDSEFRTTGTHEGVSESVGTISPDTVVRAEDSIWFLDADGRPQRLILGAGLQDPPPWLNAKETLEGQDLWYLPFAEAVYRPDLRVVLFLVASPGSPVLDRLLCFHAPSGAFLGYWDFPEPPTRLGMVKDASTLPRADGTD